MEGGQDMQSTSPSEFVPEGNWSGTDWQRGVATYSTSGAIETGSLAATANEEPWMKEYGHD